MQDLTDTQKAFLTIVQTLDLGVTRGNFSRDEVLNYDKSLRVLEGFIVENTPKEEIALEQVEEA
jgi:hypothetical protein|tara:strand:- start:63 stop:254 length:192 start_codon:yes stop_codon:yes gene_type:complete